jgi:tRNA threonylcarbamoyladenosine biosynthesis protein TsaB
MKLLAFETATEACSVALHVDGQVLERFEIAPRRHAELSLPWAEALLAEAGISRRQLDGIALSRGPGAFTGVRLAIAIAQGIALALDRPLLPVSTLQVLALRAPAEETQILSAIDARMGELYVARFERVDGLPVARDAERVCAPAAVALPEGLSAYGVGTGFAAAEGALVAQLGAWRLRGVGRARTGGAGVRARRSHCTGEGRAGLPARQRGTDPGRAAGRARGEGEGQRLSPSWRGWLIA